MPASCSLSKISIHQNLVALFCFHSTHSLINNHSPLLLFGRVIVTYDDSWYLFQEDVRLLPLAIYQIFSICFPWQLLFHPCEESFILSPLYYLCRMNYWIWSSDKLFRKHDFFLKTNILGPQDGETPPPLAQMVVIQCTSISELLVHHIAPPGGQI